MSNSLVVVVSMHTLSLKLSRMKLVKVTKLSARLLVVSFQKNTSLQLLLGSKMALTTGVLAGYGLVDVKVAIVFGSYHEVDSSEMAFKICGSMALKEAAAKAKPIILEPIMKVDVITPDTNLGDVMGDLTSGAQKLWGRMPKKVAKLSTLKFHLVKCLVIPQHFVP